MGNVHVGLPTLCAYALGAIALIGGIVLTALGKSVPGEVWLVAGFGGGGGIGATVPAVLSGMSSSSTGSSSSSTGSSSATAVEETPTATPTPAGPSSPRGA